MGIRTIAAELGLSRSTVKRALDDLYGAGLLTREPPLAENRSLGSIYTDYYEFKIKGPPPRGELALAVDSDVHDEPARRSHSKERLRQKRN